jgi:oxygen-independent coproporphyrinogen-3 oxidase
LVQLKADNSVFNFDFIAFGKFNTTKKGDRVLRDAHKRDFLVDFVSSYFADGFSLYTLELFPGSTRYHEQILKHSHAKDGLPLRKYGSDDDVYAEFGFIKSLLQENGYRRYELSNFALPGKASIHNNVYRNMENYIGVGTSAASFIDLQKIPDLRRHITDDQDAIAVRRTNTKVIADYIKGKYIDEKTLENMTDQDYRIEKVFLALRTQAGIDHLSDYVDLFVPDREQKITQWQKDGVVDYFDDILVLKDKGMDVYNSIITELFQKL